MWARVERGQSLATIESANWVGPFPAVLSGVIAGNNEATFRDPYGSGWLVRLAPTAWEAEGAGLAPGPEARARYRARIEGLQINCMRCAEGSAGEARESDGDR